MNEWKAKVEWVDYDEDIYQDATPTFGSTSSSIVTNPGVTSLTGQEVFNKVSGSYVATVQLSWKLGPNTAGVGIYASQATSSIANPGATTRSIPQQIARLTGTATTYSFQASFNQPIQYTVVGFDANDEYAAFSSAPTVTVTAAGVAVNLILGSDFASGFTYWSLTPRPGDLLVPSLDDDGDAVYTVQGSALTANISVFFQSVPASSWSPGQDVMLSAYVRDTCAAASTPNSGYITPAIIFADAAGNKTYARAPIASSGVAPNLTRVNTAATTIPAGTVHLFVWLGMDGGGPGDAPLTLNLPVGSTIAASHWLLEICDQGQTTPSEWADIDAAGHILNLFTTGSSLGLRPQGSVVPTFTGGFSYTYDSQSVTIAWAGLAILWPDGGYTIIQDGSLVITGLAAGLNGLMAYPYFDVIMGQVEFALTTVPLGTPGILSAAADTLAASVCQADGHIALAPAGLVVMTAAAGSSGGGGTGGGSNGGTGSGGGTGGIGGGGEPIRSPVGFQPD